MAKNFGSTTQLTARDKRRLARKQYRRQIRCMNNRDAADAATVSHQPDQTTAAQKLIKLNIKKEKSAARKLASALSKRSKNTPISACDSGLLLEIAMYLEAKELHQLLKVDRRWRYALLAHDSLLWKPICQSLWSGRYISNPDLRPYTETLAKSQIPAAQSSSSSRGIAPMMGRSPPSAINNQLGSNVPLSWREALCRSIVSGKASRLTEEELMNGCRWELEFLMDETIPAQEIEFFDCPMPHVRTQGFPQMPWALYEGGRVLHVHVFPEQRVTRDATSWKWTIQNKFVLIEPIREGLSTKAIDPQVVVDDLLPPPLMPISAESNSALSDLEDAVDEEESSQCDPVCEGDDSQFSRPARCSKEEEQEALRAELCMEELEATGTEGLQRTLDKPRVIVGRQRPSPAVTGHGGGCDGEDPPPLSAAGNIPRPTVCSEDSSSGCIDGPLGSFSALGSGTLCRQASSGLSTITRAFVDGVVADEWNVWKRLEYIRDCHVAGCIRQMDAVRPRRVRMTFPAHLLDQGRPRKPP